MYVTCQLTRKQILLTHLSTTYNVYRSKAFNPNNLIEISGYMHAVLRDFVVFLDRSMVLYLHKIAVSPTAIIIILHFHNDFA